MRQALHIFRKDVRFLWLPILVVLAMTALFAWSHSADPSTFAKGNARPDELPGMINFLLTMCRWYFIACLIYKEQPAGDCQFWVTRPYSWKSLLAAKALAVVAFINVPFLISDMAILWANGFSPARAAASLLARQIAITAIILLPAAAIAAATRHLAQVAFAGLTLTALYSVAHGAGDLDQSWHRLAWIPTCTAVVVLAGGTFVALIWQFARRRTPITRLVLAGVCGISAAMPMAKPFAGAIALQSLFPAASQSVSAVHLSFAPDSHDPVINGRLAIRIDGLPPATRAVADLVEAVIRGPNGASWRSGWIWSSRPYGNPAPMEWSQPWENGQNPVLYVKINQGVLDRFQSQPVNVRVSLAMTIFRAETTTRMIPDQGNYPIAGLGVCSARSSDAAGSSLLLCRSAEFQSAGFRINGQTAMDASYAPSLAAFEETPVYTSWGVGYLFHEGSPIYLTTERLIAHLRRDLEIPRIRLAEEPSQP